jgi:hypothetical protein
MTDLFFQQSLGYDREPTRPGLLRSLLRRLGGSGEDRRSGRLRRLSEACATLDGARAVIEHGWVQDQWFAPASADGSDRGGVSGACLIGAVVTAARASTPAAAAVEAGPAIDLLWDAWQETRGMLGPGVAGRAAAPAVRAARIRDLTRWNDQPDRTRDEVLALIDLASSRAIMEAMEPVGTHR